MLISHTKGTGTPELEDLDHVKPVHEFYPAATPQGESSNV